MTDRLLLSFARYEFNPGLLAPAEFDWPLADAAEDLLRSCLGKFVERNTFARALADRLTQETGTDFYEWVDHLTLDPEHFSDLSDAGLVTEPVRAPSGTTVLYHPRAMMPRVLLTEKGSRGGIPRECITSSQVQ